ncbi:unnamed protein product [Effrenium voratum]|nr:unnamed protein product [Effrenium voratum]
MPKPRDGSPRDDGHFPPKPKLRDGSSDDDGHFPPKKSYSRAGSHPNGAGADLPPKPHPRDGSQPNGADGHFQGKPLPSPSKKTKAAALYQLLQRLSPERRRSLIERSFSQRQRLALERWILDARPSPSPARGVRRKRSAEPMDKACQGRGVHCRVHGGRRLYRAHAAVGPFSVASRYDAKRATAERFRDVLAAMARRVAKARCAEEVEELFRRALVEEPRKWGLNGREDMRLCFTASVPAKHWVGRSLATPRFGLTELDLGLQAWQRLTQARSDLNMRAPFQQTHDSERAWLSLSQAYVDVWAGHGRSVAAKLSALRVRRLRATRKAWRASSVPREYLPSLAVLGVFLTRVLLWDYKQELGFAQDVLKKSLSWDSLLLGEKQEDAIASRVAEGRLKVFKAMTTFWAIAADLLLSLICVLPQLGSTDFEASPQFWSCLVAAITLRYCARPAVALTDATMQRVGILLNLLALGIGIGVSRQLQPALAAGRILIGIMSLDPIRTSVTNIVLSPLYICVAMAKEPSCDQSCMSSSIASEVFVVIQIALVCLQLDWSLRNREAVNMRLEANGRDVEISCNAAHRILTAACDACVQLTSSYEIVQPQQAFCHLVGESMLEGRSMLDFIHPSDQQRFLDAMNHSEPSANALALELVGPRGQSCDAQIYHARLHALGVEHLLGVVVTQTESMWRAYSNTSNDHSSNSHSSRGSGCDLIRQLLEQRQENEALKATCAQDEWVPLDGLDSVSLVIDATDIHAGFMIKAAQFHFGGSGQDCPNLMEWVAEKNQETMYCWIQDHVNAFAQGQSCFGLRFPGSLAGG